jgi:antitoxin component YwqK of YwqJK toxin-antitoxin module
MRGSVMAMQNLGIILLTLGAMCCWAVGRAAPADDATTPDEQRHVPGGSSDATRTPGENAATPQESKELQENVDVIEVYWSNGNLRRREEVIYGEDGNSIPHGTITQWWDNGKKRSELHYVKGQRHGPRLAWYQDGRNRSEGAYDHDRPVGTWREWNPDGTIRQELKYDDNGTRHGMSTLWYPSGQKEMEIEFVHGRKQRFETWWDEAGNIILEVNYGYDPS